MLVSKVGARLSLVHKNLWPIFEPFNFLLFCPKQFYNNLVRFIDISFKTNDSEVNENKVHEDKKNKNQFQEQQQKNFTQNDKIKSASNKKPNVNLAAIKLPSIKKVWAADKHLLHFSWWISQNATLPSWRYDNCDVYLNSIQEMNQLVIGEDLKCFYRENFASKLKSNLLDLKRYRNIMMDFYR